VLRPDDEDEDEDEDDEDDDDDDDDDDEDDDDDDDEAEAVEESTAAIQDLDSLPEPMRSTKSSDTCSCFGSGSLGTCSCTLASNSYDNETHGADDDDDAAVAAAGGVFEYGVGWYMG